MRETLRECPFCGRALLLDLVVDRAVDGRRAARLATDAAVATGCDREQLEARLRDGTGVILEALTRAQALALQELLGAEGVTASAVPRPQRASVLPGRSTRRAGRGNTSPRRWSRAGQVLAVRLAGLALVAAAAVGWFAWSSARSAGPVDGARLPGFGRGPSDSRRVTVEPETAGRTRHATAAGFVVGRRTVVTSTRAAGRVGDRVLVAGRTGGRVVAVDEWLGVAVVEVSASVGAGLVVGDCGRLGEGEVVQLPLTAAGSARVVGAPVRLLGLVWLELDAQVAATDVGAPVLGPEGELVGMLQRWPAQAGHRTLVLPVNYLGSGPEAPMELASPGASEPFERLAAQVGLGAVRRGEDLARDLERPILRSARVVAGKRLEVRVAMPSTGRPAATEVGLAVVRGVETVCPLVGRVALWQPVDRQAEGVELPGAAGWFEGRGVRVHLFVVTLQVDLDGCELQRIAGYEVVAVDGLPGLDRCALQGGPGRRGMSAERRRSLG